VSPVILIGARGVGKSSLLKIWREQARAKKMGILFFDLDLEIEVSVSMSVDAILSLRHFIPYSSAIVTNLL
jgi:shikimate kinase